MNYKDMTVGAIVAQDFSKAQVFKSLGIDFCCHGSVAFTDAVSEKGLAIDDVIARLNAETTTEDCSKKNFNEWPADLVVDYVLKYHHRNFHAHHEELLALVHKVAAVHGDNHPVLREVDRIVSDSMDELADHFHKEEVVLFPYLYQMWDAKENGTPLPPFHCGSILPPVRQMMFEHDDAGNTWMHLQKITDNFATPADGCASYRLMNEQLRQFFNDLLEHIHLENNIIFPVFLQMEQEM